MSNVQLETSLALCNQFYWPLHISNAFVLFSLRDRMRLDLYAVHCMLISNLKN